MTPMDPTGIPVTADEVDSRDALECNDDPKLTAEEWAYIQAMTEGGGH